MSRRLYLQVSEYAQAKGQKPDTVRRALRERRLRGRKFRRSWRVLASQLTRDHQPKESGT